MRSIEGVMTQSATHARVRATQKRVISGVGLASMLVLLAAGPASAAHVSIDPLFDTAGLHWNFKVALRVDLEPAESVRAFSISVIYDPSVVSFVDVEIGDPVLGNQLELTGPSPSTESVAQGSCCSRAWVNLFDTVNESDPMERALELAAINAEQADSFTLAELRFHADNMETSEIEPYVYALADVDGSAIPTTTEGLMLYSEDDVPEGTEGGGGGGEEVYITSEMPEPQSALLFSVAIAAGAWRARRRSR